MVFGLDGSVVGSITPKRKATDFRDAETLCEKAGLGCPAVIGIPVKGNKHVMCGVKSIIKEPK
jgi:hypothetical protein